MSVVEGTLYWNDDNGQVLLALNEKLRWVPNPATYNALFVPTLKPSSFTHVLAPFVDAHKGNQLLDGAQLVRDAVSGRIYLIDGINGDPSTYVKRWIISLDHFTFYHFKDDYVNLGSTTLAAIKDGQDI